MKKLKRKEALELCAKMWGIIAESDGLLDKIDALIEMGIKCDTVKSGCFACQYTCDHSNGYVNCELCPMWEYQGASFMCEEVGSPYYNYTKASRPKKVRQYAKEIAILARKRMKETTNRT